MGREVVHPRWEARVQRPVVRLVRGSVSVEGKRGAQGATGVPFLHGGARHWSGGARRLTGAGTGWHVAWGGVIAATVTTRCALTTLGRAVGDGSCRGVGSSDSLVRGWGRYGKTPDGSLQGFRWQRCCAEQLSGAQWMLKGASGFALISG